MARYINLLFLFGCTSLAMAEALPDPTQPPAALVKSAAATAANDTASAGPTLQSVIIRKGGKSAAVISGESVQLGQTYGGARLIRVSETEAVLSGPSGKEILRLTPAVEKKPVATMANAGKKK